MPLGTTEQIIYDYLTSNATIREFWTQQISQLRAEKKDDDELVDELVNRMTNVYWSNQEAWADIEGLVDRIDLMIADYTSVAYMLIGRDIRNEVRAMSAVPDAAMKPIRTEGTKDTPIPIVSSNSFAAAMDAREQIDCLFGKNKWQNRSDHVDIHGLWCWEILLEDGSQESVWFNYSLSAELTARREGGEKLSVIDSLSPKRRREFYKAIATAEAEARDNERIKKELKDGPAKEADPAGTSMTYVLVAIIVFVYAAYLFVSTNNVVNRVCIVVFGYILLVILGAALARIKKYLKRNREPQLTAKQCLELKVDKAFAEYQRINPSGNLTREIIRADWLKRHGFSDVI